MRFISLTLSAAIGLLSYPLITMAADESLDELMQGFDEPAQPTANPESPSSELDSLMQGFDDESTNTNTSEIPPPIEKNWDITTLVSLSSSYSYQQSKPATGAADYRGFTRLKLKLQPELRYKFNDTWDSVFSINSFYDFAYALKGRSKFTSEVLDNTESQFEVFELYVRGTLSRSFDIKAGRQIVVWGKSDSLRVVDILNPLDFREPGMVDIEDLRLPVTMLKMDYYIGDWDISAIVIPEIRFNKMPAYGSDFYLAGKQKLPAEDIPDNFTNSEFALAFIGNFSSWDLSLHFANYYDDQPHLVIDSSPTLKHSRLNMAGAAANFVKGSWLFKSEAAYFDGLEFANTNKEFSQAAVMAGVDYNGIADMTFSIEAMNRHMLDYERSLNTQVNNFTKENESQVSLRYTATFMHQKLQTVFLSSFFGTSPDDGGFYRASFNYEIDDGMSIVLGGIVYQAGNSLLFKNIARNDRVFIDYRYSF